MCGGASVHSSVVYVISSKFTVINLDFMGYTVLFLLRIVSYMGMFERTRVYEL